MIPGKRSLTNKMIAQALELSGGFITSAARDLDITPRALFRRVARSAYLQDVVWGIRERYLDLAESEHIQALKNHNYDAVKFHLRCQGKSRGYVEAVEGHQYSQIDHLKELIDAVRHGPIPRGQSYTDTTE
ncbi:MAG: helix-turn-helix domain-containing protein [Syntrophorhabdales bacterium]|jgi:hypothetical protein